MSGGQAAQAGAAQATSQGRGSHLWGDRRLLVFQRTDSPLHFSAQVQNTERLIDPHYCFTVYAAPSPSRALQLRK